MCRESLRLLHEPSPKELLQSCTRALDKKRPSSGLHIPPKPDSFLDMFALLTKPSNEVRIWMSQVDLDEQVVCSETRTLRLLKLYRARDRLEAVLEGNVERFREVTELQVQVFARWAFLLFWSFMHPLRTLTPTSNEP